MDIISKKSRLLYQVGDEKAKAVVDLRCFRSEKKRRGAEVIKNKGKIISEIILPRRSPETETAARQEILSSKPFLKLEKSFAYFVIAALASYSIVFSLSFIQKSIEQAEEIIGTNTRAYEQLKLAGQSASVSDFENSVNNFDSAASNFSEAKKIIDEFGYGITAILSSLPVNTPISTAKSLFQAGENISRAGKNIAEILEKASSEKSGLSLSSTSDFKANADSITFYLNEAEKNMENVEMEYVPENMKDKIELAKEQLPLVSENFENLSKDLPIMTKMLGENQAQKYLILFENNGEIRAGGGFIGSYGILDLEDGKIKKFFIGDVFNPDGQLKEKIIPPMPIQKISAAWSMHDANWFPDFPESAKKVALFYEKTGGPTVDGVIAITPNVIEKMLKITGPIEMQEYNTIVNEGNFLLETQLQVEKLYNKEENRPKKFLVDLAPKIIEKLFNTENLDNQEKIQRYLSLISLAEESFKEKHIILYHRNPDVENVIVKRGWGGKMLNSSGDYLRVVHSNINGYKTDAVVEERISHEAEIFRDGSIVDTVKIARKHLGGESEYDWYNRVNSDYMRMYVPLGTVLLEAKGHTVEDYEPPADYSDFKIDPDVKKIEDTIRIDPVSGTQVFEESGKTVFGNWVYASPKETVEVVYKYRLPYKIDFDGFTKLAERYSILVQKQLGSGGGEFVGYVKLPEEWETIWKSDNLRAKNQNESVIKTNLKTDRIYGVVFAERDINSKFQITNSK